MTSGTISLLIYTLNKVTRLWAPLVNYVALIPQDPSLPLTQDSVMYVSVYVVNIKCCKQRIVIESRELFYLC